MMYCDRCGMDILVSDGKRFIRDFLGMGMERFLHFTEDDCIKALRRRLEYLEEEISAVKEAIKEITGMSWKSAGGGT